jgi:predicted ferric reductase
MAPAWFTFGRSPFSLTSHPFSFSSSAEGDEVEIAVKALGDFTSRVHELEPGTIVYVDGPHGVFSIDQDEGPGFGFIAGGVGVTGLLSMLRTMADRGDVRPAVLVYANGDWEGVAFREELERLESRMNLTVVHVLQRPPANWPGESGYVTAELLSRLLPNQYRRFQFFICGPRTDDGRGGDRAVPFRRPRRACPHRAFRHGLTRGAQCDTSR